MRNRIRVPRMLVLWGGCLAIAALAVAQTKPGEYPAPRYPTIPDVKSADDLLDIARVVVKSPSRRETLRPGYGVKKGEKILMVVPSDFSPLVSAALAKAIREQGAQLDVLSLESRGYDPEEGRQAKREGAPQDGSVEATRMLEPGQGGGGGGSYAKVMALGEKGGYDMRSR
jgi:hypothetical protein